MCPLYVAGLIGPGERKSLQPMAARVAPADYDQLHHFVAVGPWDEAPLDAELLVQANRLVGGATQRVTVRGKADAGAAGRWRKLAPIAAVVAAVAVAIGAWWVWPHGRRVR